MAVTLCTDADFQQLIDSGKPTIVKYYADWCGNCKLIAPKYRRLSEDARFSDIAFLDINAEENEGARRTAGVDNLPFFALFKDGKLIKGKAASREEAIVALLEELNS